tara:strand:+ start:3070 stop:3579 length:510 start_codon:yes stop_codon:yes gene_type:complete
MNSARDTEGLTQKQKVFCEEYVKSGSPSKSYRIAYTSGNPANAAGGAGKLLQQIKIQEYIQSLARSTEQALAEIVFDKKKVMTDLEGLKKGAAQEKQFGPAVRAAELQGKELGMFREKTDISVHAVSDNDLIQALAQEDVNLAAELSRVLNIPTTEYKEIDNGVVSESS